MSSAAIIRSKLFPALDCHFVHQSTPLFTPIFGCDSRLTVSLVIANVWTIRRILIPIYINRIRYQFGRCPQLNASRKRSQSSETVFRYISIRVIHVKSLQTLHHPPAALLEDKCSGRMQQYGVPKDRSKTELQSVVPSHVCVACLSSFRDTWRSCLLVMTRDFCSLCCRQKRQFVVIQIQPLVLRFDKPKAAFAKTKRND